MEDCPFKESFVSQKYEVVYSYGRGSRKKLYGDVTAAGPDYGGVAGGGSTVNRGGASYCLGEVSWPDAHSTPSNSRSRYCISSELQYARC
mgnify:CR=1 FL=1